MSEKDNYAPGTYNSPDAPWNQPEPVEDTDEFADKKQEMVSERISIKGGWLAESFMEAPGLFYSQLSTLLVDLPDGEISDKMIGLAVRQMAVSYCTPPDDEVIDALEADHDI